jgi:hypothetical protein
VIPAQVEQTSLVPPASAITAGQIARIFMIFQAEYARTDSVIGMAVKRVREKAQLTKHPLFSIMLDCLSFSIREL